VGFAAVITAQLIGFVLVDRAGMGDLFGDTEFVQLVDDLARLYFQLPRQFIDSNLTHILKRFRFYRRPFISPWVKRRRQDRQRSH
jgi:hypothetical protein